MAANGDAEDGRNIEAETAFEVHLYIYDLSKELSKSFKKILKGKPLPGIWHTALVAYGREYYFASSGIESCRPGETILGEPDQILTLGKTELPYSVFLEYIFALGESSYRPGTYNLLEHNCNNFSQEVSNFLTGGPIPQELRELPQEILANKNLSGPLKEYFDKLSLRVEGSKGISFGAVPGSSQGRRTSIDYPPAETVNGDVITNGNGTTNSTPTNSKSAKKSSQQTDKNSQNGRSQSSKKSSKMPVVDTESTTEQSAKPKPEETAADSQTPPSNLDINKNVETAEQSKGNLEASQEVAEAPKIPAEVPHSNNTSEPTRDAVPRNDSTNNNSVDAERRTSDADDTPLPTFVSRRSKKYQEPAIIYPEVDGVGNYKELYEIVGEKLNDEEKQSMSELLEYLASPEGGAWALGSPHLDAIGRLLNDRNFPGEVPVLMLKILQAAALKEDVILLLHQDREHHHIMSYLYRIEGLPEEEQEEVATFMCNLCSNTSSFDWLMYISEWTEDGHSCNNSKVTVRVTVHSLLCDRPTMQDRGSALIYNLALKELFDDSATELAMAVLQFLQGDLNEEHSFRCLTALLRFMYISYNEVPALMKMLGPDVQKFNGKSERVDNLVEQIEMKLNVSISA